jgi:hypothetical protein
MPAFALKALTTKHLIGSVPRTLLALETTGKKKATAVMPQFGVLIIQNAPTTCLLVKSMSNKESWITDEEMKAAIKELQETSPICEICGVGLPKSHTEHIRQEERQRIIEIIESMRDPNLEETIEPDGWNQALESLKSKLHETHL